MVVVNLTASGKRYHLGRNWVSCTMRKFTTSAIQTPYKWCIPCLPSWATDLENLVSLKHHCKEWRFAIAFTWKCLGRVVVQINQPYLKMPKWYLFHEPVTYIDPWPRPDFSAHIAIRGGYILKFTESADCRAQTNHPWQPTLLAYPLPTHSYATCEFINVCVCTCLSIIHFLS